MSLILAGLSALLYGIADFSGGFASKRSDTSSVLVVSQSAGLFLAFVALLCLWPGLPAPSDLYWGCAAGVCGAFGLFMLYRGIAASLVAVVSPVSALVSAILPLAFGIATGERPSTWALVGTVLCLPAVFLLASEKGGGGGKAVRSALAQGCLAGIGFGLFFVLISRARAGSGLWPLVASRCASLAIVFLSALLRRKRLSLAKPSLVPTLSAGLTDMGANVCFLLASRSGLLSIVSVVTSLYPAPTVILGSIAFRERIPPRRLAGLGLALIGVALISLN